MDLSPAVSVIIPCHNAERFIGETVESVFGQTFKDYELLLVDDGSSDGTWDFIRSLGSRLRAERTTHRGASAARNRGTQLSQGRYIQYVDADDLLMPDALEKRVAALEESRADVAYSDWRHLLEQADGHYQLAEVVARRIEDVDPDAEIALFTDFWAPPVTLLYRKNIIDKISGWNESLPIIQDARFLLDAALHGARFVHVEGVGAEYRVHRRNSLSRHDPCAFLRDLLTNACQVRTWWESRGGITPDRQKALLRVYGYIARAAFGTYPEMFEKTYGIIHSLDSRYVPRYAPNTSPLLVLTSAVFGYRCAEQFALLWRWLKNRMNCGQTANEFEIKKRKYE